MIVAFLVLYSLAGVSCVYRTLRYHDIRTLCGAVFWALLAYVAWPAATLSDFCHLCETDLSRLDDQGEF